MEENDVGSNASDLPVQPDSPLLANENADIDTLIARKIGKIKEEVALILSEGKGEDYSEPKLKTLKTILSLLEVDNRGRVTKK